MNDILIRRRKFGHGDTDTQKRHTQIESTIVKTEAETVWYRCQSRDAQNCQQPPEGRREA